jgi:hypothetical protein
MTYHINDPRDYGEGAMRLFTPMTLIVVIVLAFCLIAGVAIILRSMRSGDDSVASSTCPQCGTVSDLGRSSVAVAATPGTG